MSVLFASVSDLNHCVSTSKAVCCSSRFHPALYIRFASWCINALRLDVEPVITVRIQLTKMAKKSHSICFRSITMICVKSGYAQILEKTAFRRSIRNYVRSTSRLMTSSRSGAIAAVREESVSRFQRGCGVCRQRCNKSQVLH